MYLLQKKQRVEIPSSLLMRRLKILVLIKSRYFPIDSVMVILMETDLRKNLIMEVTG